MHLVTSRVPDADDGHARRLELRRGALERAQFLGARGRVIGAVKKEDSLLVGNTYMKMGQARTVGYTAYPAPLLRAIHGLTLLIGHVHLPSSTRLRTSSHRP